MLGKAPEISETLEWMLQSRQVGEELLVKTLVHEQFSKLYRFVSSLTGSEEGDHNRRITEKIITRAVEDTPSYDENIQVQGWLFKQALSVVRELGGFSARSNDDREEQITSREEGDLKGQVAGWYAGLNWQLCTVVSLFYLFDLDVTFIASVMESSEDEVAGYLEEAQARCLAAKNKSGNGEIAERDIREILKECCPELEIDHPLEVQISERIVAHLQSKQRRRKRIIYFAEAILAILIIGSAFGMGRIIDEYTPQPTVEIIYETRVVNELIHVSPTPGPTLPPTPFPPKAILYQAVGGETLEEIAEKIYFNALILEALNNIPSDQPLRVGQQVMIGISDSRVLMPTMVSPGATLEPISAPQNPLTINSEITEIKQRIMDSTKSWQTMWADALVIQYGPPGYVGDPEFRRQQIWIDQPYFHYLLDGVNGGEVEFAYSVIGGWENLLNIQTGELVTNEGPQSSILQPDLQQLLFNTRFQENFPGDIQLTGEQSIAGREVLVLDWYPGNESPDGSAGQVGVDIPPQARIWADKSTGVILRIKEYSGKSGISPFKEIIISRIILDVPIPRRLYDRSQYLQTYFARDHTGDFALDPIPIPDDIQASGNVQDEGQYDTPPEGFMVNQSRLEIHWTSLARFNPDLGTTVDIFGDGYYLGNVDFAEPEQLQCARSPDGNRIAFSSWSSEIDFGYTPLGWIDLESIPGVQFLDAGLVPYDFVFSPDSQLLAIYACHRSGDQACGIYIADVGSGETRLFKHVEQGAELIWSPDGKAIAIQGSYLRQGKWRVLVFDYPSGNNIYDGPFDWEGFWVAHDSPIHKWGVPYPPLRGGLEVCSPPPG